MDLDILAERVTLAALGFLSGAALGRLIELAVLVHHPAVVEAEVIVEGEATVVEAERELRRHD